MPACRAARSKSLLTLPECQYQNTASHTKVPIATSCITNFGTRANIFWFGKKQNEAKCRRRINLLIKYNVNFLINSACFLDATVGRTIGTKSQLVEVTSPYWLAPQEPLDENLRGDIGEVGMRKAVFVTMAGPHLLRTISPPTRR